MNPKILFSREALHEADILALESFLHAPLPETYRDFLLAQNGGQPQPDGFPLADHSWDDFGQIDYFLCVKKDDIYDLATWVRRYQDRLPANLLPIAVDPGGNLVCLAFTGEDIGRVYLWDHENEAGEGEQPSYQNLHLISQDFSVFLSSFK